jgi:hypothetical protein
MTVTAGAQAGAIVTQLFDTFDLSTGTPYAPGQLDWTVSAGIAGLTSLAALPPVPGSVGGTWTPTYTSGALSPSAGTLVWTASGTAVYVNGITQTCGFTQSYACALPPANTNGMDASIAGGSVVIPDAGPDANLADFSAAQCGAFAGRIGPFGPSVETVCSEYYGPAVTTELTPGHCPGANVACTCLNGDPATGACRLEIAYLPLAPDFCSHACTPNAAKQ